MQLGLRSEEGVLNLWRSIIRLVLRAYKTINCDPLLRPERGTMAVVRQRRKRIKQEAKSPSVLL